MKLNDKNFHRALKNSDVVVMFSAGWAGPCNMVRPAYTEATAALRGRAICAEFDIDDNPEVPLAYGIRSLPTFVYFKNGVPVTAKAGAIPVQEILDMLDPPKKKGKKT